MTQATHVVTERGLLCGLPVRRDCGRLRKSATPAKATCLKCRALLAKIKGQE